MFSLEIDFHDGVSPPETILVRRTNAIIGSSDRAHVVIEGAASSLCELRLVRGLGREFSCHPVRRLGQAASPPSFLEGVYSGEVELRLGDLSLYVTALDIDLTLGADEFPDRASIRILRTAMASPSPTFPAVAVMGARPIFMSFPPSVPILVGRSRVCGLRLDASDVSSEHARVGIDAGRCWVEDLGSTNGTYVGEERVSGRRYLQRGETIRVGAEFVLVPVLTPDDVSGLASKSVEYPDPSLSKTFPCIVSASAEVRPSRFPLKPGARITIGRDPANDIWISAAHVSRTHVEVAFDELRGIEMTDHSSNGTFLRGQRLEREIPTAIGRELTLLDFCSGVVLGICYSEDDENAFFAGDQPAVTTPRQDEPHVGRTAFSLPLYDAGNGQPTVEPQLDAGVTAAEGPSAQSRVLERLMQGGSIGRDDQEFPASESMPSDFGDFNQDEPMLSEPFFGNDSFGAGGETGFSDFEEYQRRAQDIDASAMFDDQFAETSELDDDLFNTPQFGAHGRGFLFVLVVGLVLLVVLFCVLIFGNYFY